MAGNKNLMTDELADILCDHAAGNLRVLMNMSANLLAEGAERKLQHLDEKIFFETFNMKQKKK